MLRLLQQVNNYVTAETTQQEQVAIGIDLGTTFSCGAVISSHGESTFRYLEFDEHRTIPSVIRADYENGKVRYTSGRAAFHLNYNNPKMNNYYYAFKRFMGYANLKEDNLYDRLKGKLNYKVKVKQSGKKDVSNLYMPVFEKEVEKGQLTPLEASSKILRLFKEKMIENNMEDKGCIITIPAYFKDNQREATEAAGVAAGLKVLGTIKEPVAAAMAYQILHKQKDTKHQKFLVVDIGGGTTDLSVIDSHQGYMEVKAYAGSTFLGGENVNDNVFKFLENQLKQKHQFICSDNLEKERLRSFTEEFKVNFCNNYNDLEGEDIAQEPYTQTFSYKENDEDKDAELSMTPEEFEKINQQFFNELRSYIEEPKVMKKGSVKGKSIEKFYEKGKIEKQIDVVLLVGGSTRIYKVRDILSEIFGSEKLDMSLDADTCVAQGAAYHAATECGYLSDASQLTFSDIIPFGIGIEVQGGLFEPIILAKSTIPTKAEKTFTTSADFQKTVKITVAQGLRSAFKFNDTLGEFIFHLTKSQPRGVPQIKVIVSVEPNNQFVVTAIEEGSDNNQAVATFKRKDESLDPKNIKKMQEQYEKNKEEDESFRKLAEARGQYNSIIYSATQNANNIEDKAVKQAINSEISKLQAWYEANPDHTVETIQDRISKFNTEISRITSGEQQTPTEEKEEAKDEL